MPDSPDLATGMRLLDAMKCHGFTFRRIAPGPDGPLEGIRESDGWRDVIYLGGFSGDCFAWRERQSSLVLPGGGLVQIRTQGSALDVLTDVLGWPELPVRIAPMPSGSSAPARSSSKDSIGDQAGQLAPSRSNR